MDSSIKTLCLELRKDLAQISSLSREEKNQHLKTVSETLIKSLFQLLTQDNIEISTIELSQLCDYLIEYVCLDCSVSIQAQMILFRLKELNSSYVDSTLEEKIDNKIDMVNSKSDIYKIFNLLAHLFTFNATLSSGIFNQNTSFINLLTNEITLLSNGINNLNMESQKHLNTILILFSNACIEETSRSFVSSMYFNLILKCLTLPSISQTKCYAATIAIKSWRMIRPEILKNNSKILSLDNLSNIIIESLFQHFENSVEALSLLCTNVQIRNKVRNQKVLNTLVTLLNTEEHSKYGVLSILTLLTLPNRISKIQKKSVSSLKDSNSISNIDILKNSPVKDIDDDINKIRYITQEILKSNFITNNLVTIFKSSKSSKGIIGQSLKLMYNLIFPDIIVSEVSTSSKNFNLSEYKQIINLITAYLIGSSQNFKYNHQSFITNNDRNKISEIDLELRSIAIKSLCSPELSNNVDKIYGDGDEEFALSPIPFILEIPVQYDIDMGCSTDLKQTPFSQMKKKIFSSFDVYYALVSLAAISSLPYHKVKESIFALGFDSVLNSLNSSDERLQFASLQLLNELCELPLCIAKFFNWENTSDNYYKNFSILCHLLQSKEYDSQCLSLQFFYSVSRYEIVVVKLCQSELFCSNVNKLFQNQDNDDALIYYALLLLTHLLPLKNNFKNLSIFETSQDIITKHLHSKNEQIKEAAQLVIKYL